MYFQKKTISERTRWQIVQKIIKGDPIPSMIFIPMAVVFSCIGIGGSAYYAYASLTGQVPESGRADISAVALGGLLGTLIPLALELMVISGSWPQDPNDEDQYPCDGFKDN